MKSYLIISIIITLFLLPRCTKDRAGVPFLSDKNIFNLANDITNRNYYMAGATISPLGNSPHGNFKLWLNDMAASVLDGSDELPIGQTFPDSSLIVKQILTTEIVQLAVMYKLSSTWYWAEYTPSGEVVYGIGQGGASCIGCHSQTGNRDNTVTYTLH